ncbi:MAG: hypothetical protein KC441_06865 [Anaerolineales bacterium]|nr:hypothetical protein [Anaerolineales bacterium]
MDKGVGFNRNIKLEWLDAAASFCLEWDDEQEIRSRLEPVLAQEVRSPTNLRKTIAILINIWHKSASSNLVLHQAALDFYRSTQVVSDRVWLHYGMVMLAYPFFYHGTAVIGRLSRYEDPLTAPTIRNQLFAELGQLGSLGEATNRIVYSLRDWGVLLPAQERNHYIAQRQAFSSSQLDLEAWLLACALEIHPVEELPFVDLLHLPALFPFRFSITLDSLRSYNLFEIQRQGLGLNMVRIAK